MEKDVLYKVQLWRFYEIEVNIPWSLRPGKTASPQAKHLIWVWIMKVEGPKNQADFIEVLYVVSQDEIYT